VNPATPCIEIQRRDVSRSSAALMSIPRRLGIVLLLLIGCADPDPVPVPKPAGSNESKAPAPTSQPGPTSPSITEESPSTLLRFTSAEWSDSEQLIYHSGREAGEYSILESLGGGVGLVDIDADGWTDVMLPLGGGFREGIPYGSGLAVLRNMHGQFQTVAPGTVQVMPDDYNHGVAATDIDQDGFTDVLITGYGGVHLYLNCGDGTFRDVTASSQINDNSWSTSAAWGDINGDTHPDLFVAHYVNWSPENHPQCFARDGIRRDVCSPREFAGLPDAIWLSNGDGTYSTGDSNYAAAADGKGLATIAADFDGDRDVDIYVSNDTVPNHVYLNDRNNALRDASARSGASVSDRGTPDGSMSIDAGDYNRDGRPDLWVSNYERESFALYRNQGNGFFRHVSDIAGIQAAGGSYVGWGAAFADFDVDGDEDVLVANGHVVYHSDNAPLKQPMLLFENQEGEWFRNVAENSEVLSQPRSCRGLALSDLNHDGLPDAIVSVVDSPPVLLLNAARTNQKSNWIRLVGTESSRHPVGAALTASIAGSVILRLQKSGGSFASTSDPTLHFAAGSKGEIPVEVRWPGSDSTSTLTLSPGTSTCLVESQQGPPKLYSLPQ